MAALCDITKVIVTRTEKQMKEIRSFGSLELTGRLETQIKALLLVSGGLVILLHPMQEERSFSLTSTYVVFFLFFLVYLPPLQLLL